MQITNYILRNMGTHILHSTQNFHAKNIPLGIFFLDENTIPCPGYVCISSYATLISQLEQGISCAECYIFLTQSPDSIGELPLLSNATCFKTDMEPIPLFNLLHSILHRMGTTSLTDSEEHETFAHFIHDVITMSSTRADDIYHRLQTLSHVNDQPYRILVFEFEADTLNIVEQETIFEKIRTLFPFSNSTYYFGRIITLCQHSPAKVDQLNMSDNTLNHLQQICEKHLAWCSISGYTQNWAMVRTQYLFAKSICSIGRYIRHDKHQRVFTVAEYNAYYVMDLYFQEFSRVHHHTNYIYMLAPGLSRLIRYDRDHNSNFRKILYHYLLNDRNLTKTAKDMYIHRNTAIYKIDKALQIIEDDLENPIIRQHFLWSCMLCEYCETVLNISPEHLVVRV